MALRFHPTLTTFLKSGNYENFRAMSVYSPARLLVSRLNSHEKESSSQDIFGLFPYREILHPGRAKEFRQNVRQQTRGKSLLTLKPIQS